MNENETLRQILNKYEMEITIISVEGFLVLKSMSKTEGWTLLFIDFTNT